MDLQYLAAFGDHVPLTKFKPDDTIAALAWSADGRFVASGDNAGRVVVFQLNTSSTGKSTVSFVFQVHAHKQVFDYFRSELSEMKVNALQWVPRQSQKPLLLTCNSHEVKLWSLTGSPKINWSAFSPQGTGDEYILPTPRVQDTKYVAECVRTFTDIQTEYIVDLQSMPDQTSFLMVDVGCVKLWDIERDVKSVETYRIPGHEPEITASAVSSNGYEVIIGNDNGVIRLIDMRQAAEEVGVCCEMDSKRFTSSEQQMEGTEMVHSIASCHDGNNYVVRRFGDLQVWDIRNPSQPSAKTDVHWFPGQMEWLVSDDYVKEPFQTSVTHSGFVVTGLYSADFICWDWKNSRTSRHRAISARTPRPPPEPGRDFGKRVTCCEAHPTQDIVAVVSTAALFLFNEKST